MKEIIFFVIFIFVLISGAFAQEGDNVISPIRFDKATLSGVGLKKVELKDEPERGFYQKNLFWGKELGVFVVSTETWTNQIKSYSFDEFIYMYHGEAIVKPTTGESKVFYSGDYFFAPKGFKGEWEVIASNHSHYELSIITTSRADSSMIQLNAKHILFDKATLSGNSIVLDDSNYYEALLEKGAELTIKLIGEGIGERAIAKTRNEEFIQLLSGEISIADETGELHIFYSGDSFLLPTGFVGNWNNNGHSLVKYLSVTKTKHN